MADIHRTSYWDYNPTNITEGALPSASEPLEIRWEKNRNGKDFFHHPNYLR